jgi:hypothetical protein
MLVLYKAASWAQQLRSKSRQVIPFLAIRKVSFSGNSQSLA